VVVLVVVSTFVLFYYTDFVRAAVDNWAGDKEKGHLLKVLLGKGTGITGRVMQCARPDTISRNSSRQDDDGLVNE